jgi:hypothetical protein
MDVFYSQRAQLTAKLAKQREGEQSTRTTCTDYR